jgi:hypothetical protein
MCRRHVIYYTTITQSVERHKCLPPSVKRRKNKASFVKNTKREGRAFRVVCFSSHIVNCQWVCRIIFNQVRTCFWKSCSQTIFPNFREKLYITTPLPIRPTPGWRGVRLRIILIYIPDNFYQVMLEGLTWGD